MQTSFHDLQSKCLGYLLKPIVRYCVKRSQSLQEFIAVAKKCFIEVANEEAQKNGETPNISRLSAMTGIYRDEVKRLITQDDSVPLSKTETGLLGKVIAHWQTKGAYTTKRGDPRVLTYEGSDSEFADLVRSISKHVHHQPVLDELLRIKAVETSSRGLKLIADLMYRSPNIVTNFELVSADLEYFISAVEENIFDPQSPGNSHLHTYFDNVYEADLVKIRRWLIKQNKDLHRKAREFFSRSDKDVSESKKGEAGKLVVLGSYSFTSPLPQKRSKS